MFSPTTRVMIVDDMLTMRKLIIKCCKDIGLVDFQEASNGADAWEKISQSNPPVGLVISDWNMPHSTGIDLLKRVRADGRLGKLPFVLVTAEAEKKQVAEALAAGVSDYIVKPFTTATLKSKLEELHAKLAA